MAVPKTVTWNNFNYYLQSTSLNQFLSHKYYINSVCSDSSSFSFIHCYLHLLTVAVMDLNKNKFGCANETVQNIYNITTVPDVFVLSPIPFCRNQKNSGLQRNCTLQLTMNNVMHWTHHQALLSGPLKHCASSSPWKYFDFLAEKITNVNMTQKPNIANSTLNFINTYASNNVSMTDFLKSAIYNLVNPIGPKCLPEGSFSIENYGNERFTS
ncbi:envelope glycoprotein O [Proboscivirus elephantidbeta5]|uniref:Envelope glycoprotein O n=1 Tax=Elephant endotheliotropic herpesvirus 5 TaxID=768738 RepID=A0A075CZJ4_9BETA|nr:envelope glycoprotein O [Elephant endotheliotropic herpesvirus 5]AHC02778.1 envelope glycoprotein O [Elephant endotheliotropic herpesvirus 5]